MKLKYQQRMAKMKECLGFDHNTILSAGNGCFRIVDVNYHGPWQGEKGAIFLEIKPIGGQAQDECGNVFFERGNNNNNLIRSLRTILERYEQC